jgi:hypothetical protein
MHWNSVYRLTRLTIYKAVNLHASRLEHRRHNATFAARAIANTFFIAQV